MPDGFKKVGRARASVAALLLALLLNANAHVFAHLNDVAPSQPTVSHQGESEPSNGLSTFGNNDCLACQSLQHLRISATVTLVQLAFANEALTHWHAPLFSTYDPARATSNRAPPSV